MIAAEVALAFNGANERKTWSARPHAKDGKETVHFVGGRSNMITIVLECDTQRFQVRFNKVQAAWGDYITAIAKSLHVVLSTLKLAGQPFEAPEDHVGIEIIATSGTGVTYVRWPHQTPLTVEAATMPEVRDMADAVEDNTGPVSCIPDADGYENGN